MGSEKLNSINLENYYHIHSELEVGKIYKRSCNGYVYLVEIMYVNILIGTCKYRLLKVLSKKSPPDNISSKIWHQDADNAHVKYEEVSPILRLLYESN